MKDKKMIKNILIGLVVAIVILGIYSMLASKKEVVTGGLSSRIGSTSMGQIQEKDTVIANAEILKILGSIENIELNDDIFINPIFRKLKDKSFNIPRPVKRGRKNPFLPIGFDSFSSSSSSKEISIGEQNSIVSNFVESQTNESNGFFDNLNDNIKN
jgi:hypothetical protein